MKSKASVRIPPSPQVAAGLRPCVDEGFRPRKASARSLSRSALGASLLLLTASCGGGGSPSAKSADDEVAEKPSGEHHSSGMAASAEIGALDQGKVTKVFKGVGGELQRCLADGAKRNEFEGGDIGFIVKIDKDGKVAHAHAEQSTLGDRATEKCMLDVLGRKKWPAPEGGDIGLARNSYSFDMPNDTRPPTAWGADRVQKTLSDIGSKIGACKNGASARLSITVYVNPEGAAISAGVAGADDAVESAADCVVSVLKEAKFDSPGSWPAKVSFEL